MDDTFEIDGVTFRARTEYDDNHGAPWDEEDGHGPVSDWTRRKKLPGELVLAEDRGYFRYYDYAESCKIAQKEAWGYLPGMTKRQYAAAAAMADYDRLRQWCDNQWHYVGVIVESLDEDEDVIDSASLWGIESDADDYLDEVAHDLAAELLAA